MAVFAVTMFVEAKNENEAIMEWEKLVLAGDFDREELQVEKDYDYELETGWEEDWENVEWDDE